MIIENRPEFSIILAVHNLEKYVTDAILSVVESDFDSWELIIVDDGSKDRTRDVCKQFADNNKIKLISTQHQGLGAARNVGISYAIGNYILFLDGDDYYSKYLMSNLYSEISKNNDTDVIVFAWQEISSNGALSTAPARFREKGMTMAVWNKCVSRKMLTQHRLRFQEGVFFEDVTFTFELSLLANSFKLLDKIGYYYRIRDNSISTMLMPIERRSDIVRALNFLRQIIQYRGLEVEEFVKVCVMDSCMWHVEAILKYELNDEAKVLLNNLFSIMTEFGCSITKHGRTYSFKTKVEMYLMKNKLFGLCQVLFKICRGINRRSIKNTR